MLLSKKYIKLIKTENGRILLFAARTLKKGTIISLKDEDGEYLRLPSGEIARPRGSSAANISYTGYYCLIALRDIKKGEELVLDYQVAGGANDEEGKTDFALLNVFVKSALNMSFELSEEQNPLLSEAPEEGRLRRYPETGYVWSLEYVFQRK